MRLFRRAVGDGKVRPERSLLLRAAMREAVCKGDASGNEKIAKGVRGRATKAESSDDTASATCYLRWPKAHE